MTKELQDWVLVYIDGPDKWKRIEPFRRCVVAEQKPQMGQQARRSLPDV